MLTQRLRELEDAGVVRRRRLPPPTSANVYELTEWGAQLEPILMGLQRWGAGSPSYSGDGPVGCDAAMLALKNSFNADLADDLRVVAEIRFRSDTFRLAVVDGSIEIGRGPATRPDLTLDTDPSTLEELVFGLSRVADAEAAGKLTVGGDGALLDRLLAVFGGGGG